MSEHEFWVILSYPKKNKSFQILYCLGYHESLTPVIKKRNILENPVGTRLTRPTKRKRKVDWGPLNPQNRNYWPTGNELGQCLVGWEAAAQKLWPCYTMHALARAKENGVLKFSYPKSFTSTYPYYKHVPHLLGIEFVIGNHEEFSWQNFMALHYNIQANTDEAAHEKRTKTSNNFLVTVGDGP
jgi:hypothetical protein